MPHRDERSAGPQRQCGALTRPAVPDRQDEVRGRVRQSRQTLGSHWQTPDIRDREARIDHEAGNMLPGCLQGRQHFAS
ncbi:hypothetical protein D3C71_1899220 [compost metagenome]